MFFGQMKNLVRSVIMPLFLAVVSMAFAGVPPINVTVSDSGSKAAFKGATGANGTFATPNLKAGNYVVQFNASNSAVKNNYYSLVVSAGKKKVTANAVPGEKFIGGGVAMRVEVGSGLCITGQIVPGITAALNGSPRNRDSLNRMQDHAADTHQAGFRSSTSQIPDKMTGH